MMIKTEHNFTSSPLGLGDLEVFEDTTIGNLPTSSYSVSTDAVTSEVDETLRKSSGLPGVIVYDKSGVRGAISRRKFYEILGKRYGIAVFLKRPIGYMLRSIKVEIPILAASEMIGESVRFALDRPVEQIYEPVLVEYASGVFQLLDIYTLLLAQSRLFATLQDKLQAINEELEQRVADRTSALRSSNIKLQQEILERQKTEEQLQTRLRYEETLTKCANVLLTAGDTKGVTLETLNYLLEGVGVSHVFMGDLMEFNSGGSGIKLLHRVHLPEVPAIPPHMTVFLLDSLEYWTDTLWAGYPVIGLLDELPDKLSVLLQEFGFSSVLLLPVGEPGNWIGVLGFGERMLQRKWQSFEIQLLQTVAYMIYAYRERKEGAAKLAQARDKALEASRFKGEILAKVSHELRTPLTAIMGFSQMLAYGSYGKLQEAQEKPIEMIISSSKYLSILVNSILDQAQLESGQLVLLETPFDLIATLQEVEERMRVLANAKDLDFQMIIDPKTPQELVGDRTRLQQVLINLLGNAIKFTEKGSVALRVEIPNGKTIHYMITDTGPGIPPEDQTNIFKAFIQVDGSPTRRFSGSGLGLSISNQLVQKMNGKIILESELGEGSTFTVQVPLNYEN